MVTWIHDSKRHQCLRQLKKSIWLMKWRHNIFTKQIVQLNPEHLDTFCVVAYYFLMYRHQFTSAVFCLMYYTGDDYGKNKSKIIVSLNQSINYHLIHSMYSGFLVLTAHILLFLNFNTKNCHQRWGWVELQEHDNATSGAHICWNYNLTQVCWRCVRCSAFLSLNLEIFPICFKSTICFLCLCQ